MGELKWAATNARDWDQKIVSEIETTAEGIRARPDSGVKSKLEHQLINKSPTLSSHLFLFLHPPPSPSCSIE